MVCFIQSTSPFYRAKSKFLSTLAVINDSSDYHFQGHQNLRNGFCGDVGLLCKQGRMEEALNILGFMDHLDSYAYASLLQGCLNIGALPEAKLVHAHMLLTGFKPDMFLGTKLMIMYAKCGCLVDAGQVFEQMPERNVVSWTAMISTCSKNGHAEEALRLFYQMQRTGVQPDHFTFSSVLPACATLAALEEGKCMHEDIIRYGLLSDIFVRNALVDMYAKCGSLQDARSLFDKMPERDVVSWSSMIAGYAQNGHFDEALKLFKQMQWTSVKSNSVTFSSVLSGCARRRGLETLLPNAKNGCST